MHRRRLITMRVTTSTATVAVVVLLSIVQLVSAGCGAAEAEALFQRGLKAHQQQRHTDAVREYTAVLECRKSAETYHNRAHVHHALGDMQSAVNDMAEACRLNSDYLDAHFHLAVWLSQAGMTDGAIQHFSESVRIKPSYATAYTNLGVMYQQQGRVAQALQQYEYSLKIQPDYVENYFNIGKAYQELGDTPSIEKAIDAFKTAVKIKPTYYEAYATLGGALTPLRKWKESTKILRDALKLNPTNAEGVYLLTHALMQLCSWKELDRVFPTLRRLVKERLDSGQRPGVEPYAALTFPWSNEELRAISEFHSKEQAQSVVHAQKFKYTANLAKGHKLRVGLKSFDIGDHQSSYLIYSCIRELAKRPGVTMYIYGLRPDDGSNLRRLFASIGGQRWRDGSAMPTADIAAAINKDKVHILMDMDGHFRNSRPALLAMKPAPVQIIYPMFVGSAGMEFMPNMFSDTISTPPELVSGFSEKFIYVPNTYYTNSHALTGGRKERAGEVGSDGTPPSRWGAEERTKQGLPAGDDVKAPVICNFNQYYKLDAETFAVWMRLLNAVNGSSFWMRSDSDDAMKTLHKAAKAAGVKKKRVVFAKWAETSEEHLTRTSLASLSVDMPLYNSMTTACDTLWAGVPIITTPRTKMVSRLASSLMRAMGVSELITRDLGEYEALATALLRHPKALAKLRAKVELHRSTSSLYDMPRKAAELHTGLKLAWEAHASGIKGALNYAVHDHHGDL